MVEWIERLGVRVAARVPTGVHLSEANAGYLSAKARNGHAGLDEAALDEAALERGPAQERSTSCAAC